MPAAWNAIFRFWSFFFGTIETQTISYLKMEDIVMDELIKLVVQKTGISEAQAKTAIDTVLGFLKKKLPAPLAGQVDAVLAGSEAANAIKGLGGLLGGKKK